MAFGGHGVFKINIQHVTYEGYSEYTGGKGFDGSDAGYMSALGRRYESEIKHHDMQDRWL